MSISVLPTTYGIVISDNGDSELSKQITRAIRGYQGDIALQIHSKESGIGIPVIVYRLEAPGNIVMFKKWYSHPNTPFHIEMLIPTVMNEETLTQEVNDSLYVALVSLIKPV